MVLYYDKDYFLIEEEENSVTSIHKRSFKADSRSSEVGLCFHLSVCTRPWRHMSCSLESVLNLAASAFQNTLAGVPSLSFQFSPRPSVTRRSSPLLPPSTPFFFPLISHLHLHLRSSLSRIVPHRSHPLPSTAYVKVQESAAIKPRCSLALSRQPSTTCYYCTKSERHSERVRITSSGGPSLQSADISRPRYSSRSKQWRQREAHENVNCVNRTYRGDPRQTEHLDR